MNCASWGDLFGVVMWWRRAGFGKLDQEGIVVVEGTVILRLEIDQVGATIVHGVPVSMVTDKAVRSLGDHTCHVELTALVGPRILGNGIP